MGLLVNGEWQDRWYDTKKSGGAFVRKESSFRNWVTADGSAGPSGAAGFQAEADRYHLYVSMACPWAHRTLIFRQLKSLTALIGITIVEPLMLEQGWSLSHEQASLSPTPETTFLYQVYQAADHQYSGRVTVPVLWDKELRTIVSNESAEIIRMFNRAFNDLTGNEEDYYPPALRPIIDELNSRIYQAFNNGVYRAGFATTPQAYSEAVDEIFNCLDWLEARLSDQPYLAGNQLTEADWRLFTTLVRFDAVYFGHFKCNLRQITDYPHLSNYLRDLYQFPGIADTVDMDQIKAHYYMSHKTINPSGIVPIGPLQDFNEPHDRRRFNQAGEQFPPT